MKLNRWITILIFALTGLACAILCSFIGAAHSRGGCGDECESAEILMAWLITCLIIFPIIGHYVWGKYHPPERCRALIKSIIILILACFASSLFWYAINLHQRYWKIEGDLPHLNIDQSEMMITKRAVPGRTNIGEKITLQPWKRCVSEGGVADCTKRPHEIALYCRTAGKTTIVYVEESHWRSLAYIPEESLPYTDRDISEIVHPTCNAR